LVELGGCSTEDDNTIDGLVAVVDARVRLTEASAQQTNVHPRRMPDRGRWAGSLVMRHAMSRRPREP
jgi:hypothetical protein